MTTAPAYGCVLQTVQNVIRIAIALGFALATLALVYAGFTWMTSGTSAERRSQGKNLLLNVAVGLAVMLSAWLIVDYVMKTLYDGPKSGFGPWNNILAGQSSDGSSNYCVKPTKQQNITSGTVSIVVTPGQTANPPSGTVSSPSLSQQAALSKLQAAGVTVSSTGSCSDPSISTCTSLAGMQQNTVDQIVAIKKACGTSCTVTVTGGTETGHADGGLSHSTGYKVDLGTSLDSFFKQNLTPAGMRGADARYLDSCGNEYVREPTHWDVTVSKGVCTTL